jgi:hypothetical protein
MLPVAVVDIDDVEGAAADDVVGWKVLQAEIFFKYNLTNVNYKSIDK